MVRLALFAISCIISPFILIQASAIDGDKNILDLRVLNNIMDGITQLNNHFRLAVELLKQIAEYHRSEVKKIYQIFLLCIQFLVLL